MKILFIGNSYTYYNDMPKIFEKICRENGVDMEAESVTSGGYSLAHYLSDGNEKGIEAKRRLKENRYDFVVLQEFSTGPAKNPETFFRCVREFMPLIRQNGATPLLYETWGRADGCEVLTKNGWTHETMQEKLKTAYETAAKENGIKVVYAGERFHEAYRKGVQVFDPDGTHPSLEGSEIVARAFYDALFA